MDALFKTLSIRLVEKFPAFMEPKFNYRVDNSPQIIKNLMIKILMLKV